MYLHNAVKNAVSVQKHLYNSLRVSFSQIENKLDPLQIAIAVQSLFISCGTAYFFRSYSNVNLYFSYFFGSSERIFVLTYNDFTYPTMCFIHNFAFHFSHLAFA